jgi:lactase-phlorizin hydrolase
MWDRLIHDQQKIIEDKSTGDVACNSYHMYTDNVGLLKDLLTNSLLGAESFLRG